MEVVVMPASPVLSDRTDRTSARPAWRPRPRRHLSLRSRFNWALTHALAARSLTRTNDDERQAGCHGFIAICLDR